MLISHRSSVAYGQELEPYRYDLQTSASDFAQEFFGSVRYPQRSQLLNMGNVGIGMSTELDCGKLDIRANIKGEFRKLQEQVKAIIPRTASDVTDLVSRAAMISVCCAPRRRCV